MFLYIKRHDVWEQVKLTVPYLLSHKQMAELIIKEQHKHGVSLII